MFRIKRLHLYTLTSFLPVFFMTFMISNFILVMQMLWRYIDYIVGKGIDMETFAKFFGYAALSLIPMSLPLAILLASLMTFGNFGEKLELLAMKAAGISLFNIMKPLIILMVFVSVGAFFFQDRVNPKVQVKLMSLLASFKQKSPELSIPEGAFYSEIPGVTLYVRSKDPEKKTLNDVMIYDFSNGFENAAVTLADYATLRFTSDKKNLVFTLHQGEGFSNFSNQQTYATNIPYRRESFRTKQIVIDYDANLNIVDESNFSSSHLTKNTKELLGIVDSVKQILDSVNRKTKLAFTQHRYLGRQQQAGHRLATLETIRKHSLSKPFYPNMDSLIQSSDQASMNSIAGTALRNVSDIKNDLEYRQMEVASETYQFRRCSIEFHRKFTLSFACLIFFFIGAPLGAIIRKGGIGVSALVSVILFIFYYMIDTAGYKFARDGVWDPTLGGWISSAVLFPLGIFLTYKSVKDSVLLNADAYLIFFKTWMNPKHVYKHALVALRRNKKLHTHETI
jgi:lipopolysaccharide export system permease protein